MPQTLQGSFHQYQVVRKLGQGAFGEVSLAREVDTGAVVALKRIPVRSCEGLPDNVAREMRALQCVDHPNVVRLLDVFAKGQALLLVQEYCVADLASLLRAAITPVPPPVVKSITQQLLLGLQAVHDAGIMHRDLKPANVLLSHKGVVKLADFGLARPLAPGARPLYTHTVATRWYRAPELLYGARTYGPAVDLWAVAMTLAELIGLAPLLPGENDIDQLGKVIRAFGSVEDAWPGVSQLPDWGKVTFPAAKAQPLAQLLPGAPPRALDLLAQLTRYDPAKRPTAAQSLQHEYFTAPPRPANHDEIVAWLHRVQQPPTIPLNTPFRPADLQ